MRGDLVTCWLDDDETNPQHMGTVKHFGKMKLINGHEDDKIGDVFVLDHSKGRLEKKRR